MFKRKQEPFHHTQIIVFILSVNNNIFEHSFQVLLLQTHEEACYPYRYQYQPPIYVYILLEISSDWILKLRIKNFFRSIITQCPHLVISKNNVNMFYYYISTGGVFCIG